MRPSFFLWPWTQYYGVEPMESVPLQRFNPGGTARLDTETHGEAFLVMAMLVGILAPLKYNVHIIFYVYIYIYI